MNIGYLGPSGTFSERALWEYIDTLKMNRKNVVAVPFPSLSSLVHAIALGQITQCVLPWENSTEGVVTEAMDAMISSQYTHVVGEVLLYVSHVLFSNKQTPLADITDVLSHPQVLAQCHYYLRKNCPNASLHQWSSSAAAANKVANDRSIFPAHAHLAVIGDQNLSSQFDLIPLASNIQDNPENATRFLVLGQHPTPPTGHDKTTLIFTTKKDIPGSLYHSLGVFSDRKINLSSISSRPAKKSLGDYLFCIDIDGHQQDLIVKEALADLMSRASFFKVLGSYPCFIKKETSHA